MERWWGEIYRRMKEGGEPAKAVAVAVAVALS